MDNQEYEQKKQECWEEFKRTNLDGEVQWQPVNRYDVFCATFDRAYALGREKEIISQDEIDKAAEDYVSFKKGGKCMLSYIIERACRRAFKGGANFALGKQEKDGIDLKKLNEMLDDTLKKETKESLNQWLSKKDADTVTINKGEYDKLCKTWDDEPIELEIIIKRKKK